MVHFGYVLPPPKKQTQSHKGLWNPRHRPGPGLAEDEPEVSPSEPPLHDPQEPRPGRKPPPSRAPVTTPPSLLSSLLVYIFKLKQILPSALLICFHAKTKTKQNVVNDLPTQRLTHSHSPPQVAESVEPGGRWLHLPLVLQGCEPRAGMPRPAPCKAGRWASAPVLASWKESG